MMNDAALIVAGDFNETNLKKVMLDLQEQPHSNFAEDEVSKKT